MKNAQAQEMWNAMKAALSYEVGLLQSYASDVYDCDRKAVGAMWAEDSKYLWLVRENGSHLSRVGVGEKRIEVEAALRCLERDIDAQKHCIWLIETDAAGSTSLKKVSRQRALDWCAWRQYEARDGQVRRDGGSVATVKVGPARRGPGIWGCDMEIQTKEKDPRRVDVLAAYCHGAELATKLLGLFVKIGPVRVNGEPIDNVAPVFEIDLGETVEAETVG